LESTAGCIYFRRKITDEAVLRPGDTIRKSNEFAS